MTPVPELLAVKLELAILKVQQAIALHAARVAEQNALLEEARTAVGAPKGHLYHLDTRTFQPPSGPTPLSTSRTRQARRARGGA